MSYYILDKDENIKGVLDNEGKGCPFFDDVHENAIADSSASDNGQLSKIWTETLTLSVPYGYEETEFLERGGQILFRDSNGLWKLFTIYEMEDSINGNTHKKTIECFNSCIWKMSHTYIEESTFSIANSTNVFSYIFERSGWLLEDFNEFYEGSVKSFTVGEGTSQSALDNALKEFDVEIEAFVTLNGGKIGQKCVRLVDKLGEETGQRFEYRHNLKGATRKSIETDFYTKLYVFGGSGSNSKKVSIQSVNKIKDPDTKLYEYKPFLVDDDANDYYNNGNDYIEGVITNEDILSKTGLLDWGKKQFDYYNHPKFEYTIDVALLDEYPNIGDKITVVDFEMKPEMTVTARVVGTNFSLSEPQQDTVVLGEFTTLNVVTPNLIWQLQAKASQALQKATEEAFRVVVMTPDDNDFTSKDETKTLIAQVYEGNQLVTPRYPQSSFSWIKSDLNGVIDDDWTESHEGFGNELVLNILDSDANYNCVFDDAISNTFFLEKDFKFFCKLESTDSMDRQFRNVAQYANVEPISKNVFWSMVYRGYPKAIKDVAESFTITRTDMTGKILDRMFCKQMGHGSYFGIENINGTIYIYHTFKNVTTGVQSSVRFPYVAGKTYDTSGAGMTKYNKEGTRVNYDKKNGYFMTSTKSADKAVYRIFKKSTFLTANPKAVHTFSASGFGIRSSQTSQSSTLDYPYLYGMWGANGGTISTNDNPKLCVIDVRTGEKVHEIAFQFNQGDIQAEDIMHEPEAISVYYEGGVKYLIVGFAFSSEIESETSLPFYNKLFRLKIDNF